MATKTPEDLTRVQAYVDQTADQIASLSPQQFEALFGIPTVEENGRIAWVQADVEGKAHIINPQTGVSEVELIETPLGEPIEIGLLRVVTEREKRLRTAQEKTFEDLLAQGANVVAVFGPQEIPNWDRRNADLHGRIKPIQMSLLRGVILAYKGLDIGLAVGSRKRDLFSPEEPVWQYGAFPTSQMTVSYDSGHGTRARERVPRGSIDHLGFLAESALTSSGKVYVDGDSFSVQPGSYANGDLTDLVRTALANS